MSYFVRVFSQSDDDTSLRSICDCIKEEGYQFATDPGCEDEAFAARDWSLLALQYNPDCPCIEMERNRKDMRDDMFFMEQQEFIETIKALPYSKGQKKALEIVKNAMQIYAFDCDDEMGEEGWDFLECILDHLCDATDGYVQVDGEGIYAKDGALLLELADE